MNQELNGAGGVLLWGFIRGRVEELHRVWDGLVKDSDPPVAPDLEGWTRATAAARLLPPVEPLQEEEIRTLEGSGLDEILKLGGAQPHFRSSLESMMAQEVKFAFCWLPLRKLACPIALIDMEHVERLRAELGGDDDAAMVRFAFHGGGPTRFKAAVQGRSLIITTTDKGATLSPPRIEAGADGSLSVRVEVGVVAEFIHVFIVNDRAYLANGMHRCYTLASMGKTEVPCLMMESVSPPLIDSFYPVFQQNAMVAPRPPLVTDFLNEELTTRLPLQRSQKILRVTTEEFPVPSL